VDTRQATGGEVGSVNRVPFGFFVPENSGYTIVDSALDSMRFMLHVSSRDQDGRLYCRSVDADANGELVPYRGRYMDGVGYCADSIFGAHVFIRMGRALLRPELEEAGFSYLDHALATGFFDDEEVPVLLYRNCDTAVFLHNLEARPDYLELPHIARVGDQLLRVAALDHDARRAERCRAVARRTAEWVAATERCANGWFPRRCTPTGAVVEYAPDAFGPTDLSEMRLPDPVFDSSGGGAFALQLLAGCTRLDLGDYTTELNAALSAVDAAGGFFGSTNTDTGDPSENVSYAIMFQALVECADLLGDEQLESFAFERCLAGLAQFQLTTDLNGVDTKGLLYMEDSWNAACMWEMAEAAQAYLVAYRRRGSLADCGAALTILRAIARHHHGEHGFLTEATDWDGHSAAERHFPGERYGDIRTTHPFLNNLHIVQPTVTYLEEFCFEQHADDARSLIDLEGNPLCTLPLKEQQWMHP
jgi:hypothetical protein